jgi:phosphopantetheine adenylyltransferase
VISTEMQQTGNKKVIHRRTREIICNTFDYNYENNMRAFLNSSMDQSVESVFYQNVVLLLLDLC